MPPKRRTAKLRDHRITAEAVEAFKTARMHHETYSACIRNNSSEGCKSDKPGREHCADCRTYVAESGRLHLLLGLKPWECCPFWVEPGQVARDDDEAQAIQLREELERLARG